MTHQPAGRAYFLQDLLQTVADQGRGLVARAFGQGQASVATGLPLEQLVARLLGGRGEASGTALASEIMSRYQALDPQGKIAFLTFLADRFAPDAEAIRHAFQRFDASPSREALRVLTDAVEPPRQEVIRRLNRAPGNTLHLVDMRADLLAAIPGHPELADMDADFLHLFASWFNRGFLVMRRIDWATPAHILEKIIRYEAVHAIESWDDLRRRLQPEDRRCFAFFHPSLIDEPLIFVEVALTQDIPGAIAPILAADRTPIRARDATTAVFYSISNCQRGLAKVSFGNFLIKQVAEELKREFANLQTFVTLSPVPGFRKWLETGPALAWADPEEVAALESLRDGRAPAPGAQPAVRKALAAYMLLAKASSGQPRDPVQRFHLGNGACLERLNPGADLSIKGLAESYGAMVNYLYDLPMVESRHERYAQTGEVAVSTQLQREFPQFLARSGQR